MCWLFCLGSLILVMTIESILGSRASVNLRAPASDPTKQWPHLRGLDLDFFGGRNWRLRHLPTVRSLFSPVLEPRCFPLPLLPHRFFLTTFFFQLVLLPNEKSTLPRPNQSPLKDGAWKMIHFLFGAKVKSLLVSGPRLHQQNPHPIRPFSHTPSEIFTTSGAGAQPHKGSLSRPG